jgi:hypothetical protein
MATNLTNVAVMASFCTRNLQESLRAFRDNLDMVKAHQDADTQGQGHARLRCGALAGALEAEYSSLKEAEKSAMAAAKGAQQVYGERGQMPFEEFCRHVMGIVQSLHKASAEVHGHVDFWEQQIASPTREAEVHGHVELWESPTREDAVPPALPVKETSVTSLAQEIADTRDRVAAIVVGKRNMVQTDETNMPTQRRGPGNTDGHQFAAPARASEVNAPSCLRHMSERTDGGHAIEQAAPEQRTRRMTLQDTSSVEQTEHAEERARRRSLQEGPNEERVRRLSHFHDGATNRVSWLSSGTSVRHAVHNYNDLA